MVTFVWRNITWRICILCQFAKPLSSNALCFTLSLARTLIRKRRTAVIKTALKCVHKFVHTLDNGQSERSVLSYQPANQSRTTLQRVSCLVPDSIHSRLLSNLFISNEYNFNFNFCCGAMAIPDTLSSRRLEHGSRPGRRKERGRFAVWSKNCRDNFAATKCG